MRFDGKVAWITGGAAGIGRATARRIVDEGGRIVCMDRSADDLASTVAELGASCVTFEGDVADRDDLARAADLALDRFGRLDVCVANAGARIYGPVADATLDDWETIVAVNLRGVADTAATAATCMTHGGAIVLVSSQNAITGRASMPLYDATKAGVLSLTRSMAIEYASRGVRVNAVCPGFTVTDFHTRRAGGTDVRATQVGLLKRPAEPGELAAAIAFLASDDASYVTATTLMVDGGAHAS